MRTVHARLLVLALFVIASHGAYAAQGTSMLGADSMLETIQLAIKPAFNTLSTQAITWLAAFAGLQFFITNYKLLLGDADLTAAIGKLVGSVAWVGFCLYVVKEGPGFIARVGDQMSHVVGSVPEPGTIMSNTFEVAAKVGALALAVSAIPLIGDVAGNGILFMMILVLIVGMYFAAKIFMLQLELALIVMLSPMSFSLLGLSALKDQGIAPFKSLLALAYRMVLVGVILAAFSAISDSLSTTFSGMTKTDFLTDGYQAVLKPIVQAIGAYAVLAFLLFKSDSIASSLAAGTVSTSASDLTAAAAAGAAAGTVAATGGAALAGAGGKAPESMANFMSNLGSGGSVSNASPMGSGGDIPSFAPPAASMSAGSTVGGVSTGAASSSSADRPSRPGSSGTPTTSVASGRYGTGLPAEPAAKLQPGQSAATTGANETPAALQGNAVDRPAAALDAGSQSAQPGADLSATESGQQAASEQQAEQRGASQVKVPVFDGASTPTSAPSSHPPKPPTAAASPITSGSYGSPPEAIGSADNATIGGAPGAPSQTVSSKLEEQLGQLVEHLSQPNKPGAGQQMRELDRHLAHDKSTTGVSINTHHD